MTSGTDRGGCLLIVSIDDVATGLLVNATTAVGKWLGTAARAARSGRGRTGDDLAVARWFETYKVTSHVPAMPGLSDASRARLGILLSGDEAQAAVQGLLAVRLTDGPNEDAKRARDAFTFALASVNDPEILAYANVLAEYYDDEISDLVGRLGDSPLLAQVRSEGLSARMIAVLNAIERHTSALHARPAARTESDFLSRYRAHVLDQHGKLEPPDFERRRRVPIGDIYVPTRIYQEGDLERNQTDPDHEPPSITVWELADRLDRTVLLGDPGGGKTTASTVLMQYFSSVSERRIPFLVTLRNFAAEDPPARSVVGFIEHALETLYQCPAPAGLIDLLLLTGRAVVIFDGLDELLDTTRRTDVSTRVERFSMEYPLAAILVTSRVVGYDQARLDDSQFTSYRLGEFHDEDVAEYARKWFDLDAGGQADDAGAFMSESESIHDLRANPLLLSLLCILYRGEGSLPRNRAEVYEQCANLLFRRWDARRHIHQELRAGHLVEPALRHIAWWIFSRTDTQTAVTERELVTVTRDFLHKRGFESLESSLAAAREFIEFSRGRMWVFSDIGITETGEKLYTFTHRTFLEYFAATQLAYSSDTPERLARTLAPHVARGEWEVVGELAVQIKDATSREGATRIYTTLLDEKIQRRMEGRSYVLQFLARTLRSVTPAPDVVRLLSRQTLDFMFAGDPDDSTRCFPLAWLMASCVTCTDTVDEEVSAYIRSMMSSIDSEIHAYGLRLSLWLSFALVMPGIGASRVTTTEKLRNYWNNRQHELTEEHRDKLIAFASEAPEIAYGAFLRELISFEDMIRMHDGLLILFTNQPMNIFHQSWGSFFNSSFWAIIYEYDNQHLSSDLEQIALLGRHLSVNCSTPWLNGPFDPFLRETGDVKIRSRESLQLDQTTFLGYAAIALISCEASDNWAMQVLKTFGNRRQPTVLEPLLPYIELRRRPGSEILLSDLPVPEEWRVVLQDWAKGKINFIGSVPES